MIKKNIVLALLLFIVFGAAIGFTDIEIDDTESGSDVAGRT